MSRKSALWLTGLAAVVIVGTIALLLAFPGRDWTTFESAEVIRAKSTPEAAYEGVSKVADRTSSVRPGRNVVFEVSCPDGVAALDCGAGAARALSIWFGANGSTWAGTSGDPGEVDWLLVNITTPTAGGGGPQLIGDVQPVSDLEPANTEDVLARFQWNGAGDLGDVPAAEWCSQHHDAAFCRTFEAEACPGAPVKEPAIQRYCPRPQ